jgi:hypothetical protein
MALVLRRRAASSCEVWSILTDGVYGGIFLAFTAESRNTTYVSGERQFQHCIKV